MVTPKGTGPLTTEHMHAIVHGRVQGVNFRATTVHIANKMDITGWVRNNSNGTVEVVAEGPREQLELFLEYLHEGPPSAQVTHIDVTWLESSGHRDSFVVRY